MAEALPQIDVETARRLFLHSQALLDDPTRRASADRVYTLVERLGFVQIDSILVVERAHHLILAARLDGYRPAMLARLLERDRRLFEHWTHDAAAIPSVWFAHWRPRFERARTAIERNRWWQERLGPDAATVVAHVRDRIRAEGPLQAKDFEHDRKGTPGGWWGWKPQKAALEYLWHTGELLVARRAQFQKVYDLVERVLPEHAAAPPPSPDAWRDWAFRSAIERLVVATAGEIAAFWGRLGPSDAHAWCADAARAGTLVPVRVASADGSRPRSAWALSDWERRAARLAAPPERLRLLSPFDPAVHDRGRTRRLFDFDYSFEAFTPAAKRRYGYYVLPLLERDRFVGRADVARDDGRLVVRQVWWEPRMRAGRARTRALSLAVARLAVCCGLEPSRVR
jgi:uncharacterized protein YcaQ